MSDEALLRRALAALGPYRSELVVVGAWAHRLFERHPLAQPLDYPILSTKDADLAAPERLPVIGDPIPKLLVAEGFEQQITGQQALGVMKFVARDGDGFYVEFIAPLTGGETDRKGKSRDLVVVGGATAQRLRHVELLHIEPWEIALGGDVVARVANPASYLLQKVLTRRAGAGRAKRGKDLLYIYDTLQIFGARLSALQPLGARMMACLHLKHAENPWERLDYASAAPLAVKVAEATGRPSPPDTIGIERTCRFGLRCLFGGG
ncbi:MAG: hypothetical protein IPK80_24580 [Nannocystis sp.]|nr:hypothetical protein [Nannocystis sp.]